MILSGARALARASNSRGPAARYGSGYGRSISILISILIAMSSKLG